MKGFKTKFDDAHRRIKELEEELAMAKTIIKSTEEAKNVVAE